MRSGSGFAARSGGAAVEDHNWLYDGCRGACACVTEGMMVAIVETGGKELIRAS